MWVSRRELNVRKNVSIMFCAKQIRKTLALYFEGLIIPRSRKHKLRLFSWRRGQELSRQPFFVYPTIVDPTFAQYFEGFISPRSRKHKDLCFSLFLKNVMWVSHIWIQKDCFDHVLCKYIYTPWPRRRVYTVLSLFSPKCPSPFIRKNSLLGIVSTNSFNQATPLLPTVDGRLPTFQNIPTFERVFASVFETELRSTNWARTTIKFTVHQLFGCSGVVHPTNMSEPT